MSNLPESLRGTKWEIAEWSGVGEGWWSLLEKIHSQVSEVDPGYVVLQFKEKFGGLRVYLYPSDDISDEKRNQINELVDKIEAESYTVCEECGSPGEVRRSGWISTLCDPCEEARSKKKKEFEESVYGTGYRSI